MININLLPMERRQKSFPVHKVYLFGIYFVLTITVLLWGYNLGMYKYSQSKLNNIRNAIGELSLWQQRYELNEVQNAKITRRGGVVKKLNDARILWSDSLADLGNVTPYGVWLTTVSQNSDKSNPNAVAIEGKALKMDEVLRFVHNLQENPQIATVSLKGTKLTKQGTGPNALSIIDFSVTLVRMGGVSHAK